MKKIDFYFDFLSPFSFFCWKRHKDFLKKADYEIEYKPVLMGKLFSKHGFPGPGEIEAKRNYELKKCFRYAAKNQIKFMPPSQFPFNPLAIARCATLSASKTGQVEVIDFIFHQVWAQGQILEDPEELSRLFQTANLDSRIVDLSFEKDAKLELKKNIKEALDKGIFGVPTLAIDDEFFWGNDELYALKNYLEENDNWDKSLYNRLIN